MPNFNEVMNMKAEDVKKPLPVPSGWYIGVVSKPPEGRKLAISGVEQEVVDFDIKLLSPSKEVDTSALSEWTSKFGDLNGFRLQPKTFFIEDPAGRFAMVQFMTETLGVDKVGKSNGQMAAESTGRQLLVQIIHKPYQSKATGQMELAANIGLTAKA